MKQNKLYFILIIAAIFSLSFHGVHAYSKNDGLSEDPFNEEKIKFKITGLYKNLFIFTKTDNYTGDNSLTVKSKNLVSDLNRIRVTPEFSYSELIFIHIDYDNEIFSSNYNKSHEFDNYWRYSGYNEFLDLTREPYYGEKIFYRTKIHRAYSKITIKDFTVTIGRQQIRFGSGLLWNPLVILNPISPTFVEGAEEQNGTDALKIDYYFSDITELSLVYSPKRENNKISKLRVKNSNAVSRLKFTVHETDIAILAGQVSGRAIGGLDITTILFDGILRGSVLYSKPEDEKYFITGNSGYEYTFKNGIYFLVEYFYNQSGLNYNSNLLTTYTQSIYSGLNQDNYDILSNRIITYNRHYMGIALGYDFHPLVRGDLFSIYDFQGRGFFVNITLKYNIFENVDLSAGIIFGHVFKGSDKTSDFTEFGDYNFYYVSLSVYL